VTIGDAGNILLSGLSIGGVYALIALAYNIVFMTTNVLNLAKGALLMSGAMLGVLFYSWFGWPWYAALGVTVAAGVVLALIEYFVAVRASLRGNSEGWIISTFAFALLLQALFALGMQNQVRSFPDLLPNVPVATLGGIRIVPQQIGMIVCALAVAGLLSLLIRRTLLGKALSAIAQDRDAAALRGIPIQRLSLLAFAAGGAIAAFTGFLAGPITSAYPSMGLSFALYGFIAAVIGGMPRIDGALAGGFILGIIETVTAYLFDPSYKDLVALVAVLALLAVRPAGLLGRGALRRV
jgi:branched-chain amino acid transport system permease protein